MSKIVPTCVIALVLAGCSGDTEADPDRATTDAGADVVLPEAALPDANSGDSNSPNAECDPFGAWALTYETDYPGHCTQADIYTLTLSLNDEGIAEGVFGEGTSPPQLSPDRCSVKISSWLTWENEVESGDLSHKLDLTFSGDTATGTLVYEEGGLCATDGITKATGKRVQ